MELSKELLAAMLMHVACHPEDFVVEEIADLLKAAAEVLVEGEQPLPLETFRELEEMDPKGSA